MSARLDFEARLRALRAPKSSASALDAPATVGPSAVSASSIDYGSNSGGSSLAGPLDHALAWPSVPLAPTTAASTRRASFSARQDSLSSTAVAVDEHGWPAAPNMTVQRTRDGWPEVPGALKGERRPSSAPPSWLLQSPPRSSPHPQPPEQQPHQEREKSPPQRQSHPLFEPTELQQYALRTEPPRRQSQQPEHQQYAQQQPVGQRYESPQPPVYGQCGVQTRQPELSRDFRQNQPSKSRRQEREAQAPAQPLLLGPEYSEAVRVAQRAIESERLRHVHTAIDDYILAGQLLIGIGRQQRQAPHLQDVVKKKALALLQRAEGLAAWIRQVQAQDVSQQALDAAFEASQASQDRALSEQEALVSKMRSDNAEMKQRLNQLVVLTKMRARLRRVVRDRRARKQAEAAAAAASGDTAALSSPSLGPDLNDVEGESDDDDNHVVDEWYDGGGSVLADDDDDDDEYAHLPLPSSVASLRRHEPAVATVPSSQEEQKISLVNELRSAIGLPEIDHLRKFEPLSADPTGDAKQRKLQQDLERARQEADELRASVQSMERCLRLAAQHSKQRSIKMEQAKQEDLARVRQELELVREQLERERRLSSVSSIASRRSLVHSDAGDREDLESPESMRSLRSSLFKVFSRKKSRESLSNIRGIHTNDLRDPEHGRSVAQRTSEAQSSPRHRSVSKLQEFHPQEPHRFNPGKEPGADDDDGGVWL